MDIVQTLQVSECPGRGRFIRAISSQLLRNAFIKGCQLASSYRFHDPDRYASCGQDFVFFLSVLQGPVQIIQLYLAELQFIAVTVQKAVDSSRSRMSGETKMSDPSLVFLFDEIIDYPPFRILIYADGVFIDVMQQIEIKVIDFHRLQLILEYFCRIIRASYLMSRVLSGDVIRVTGIFLQGLAQFDLGIAVMIRLSCIKIVDAVLYRIIDHLLEFCRIDAFIRV